MEKQGISVVIPTFNGKHILEKYLPSVIETCKRYSLEKTEIVIVDDASQDGTEEYLRSEYPFVKLIKHSVNKGFSGSANSGIWAAKNKLAVLLNNDVETEKDFLTNIAQNFEREDVFAVRPGLMDVYGDSLAENKRISGGFRYGFFDVPKKIEKEIKFAFFAGGGAAAYDKKKFVELGGFDEMFAPFYYEDVELSYRAWKRGWKIVYDPRSRAYHKGGATISKLFCRSYIMAVGERNNYFLVWKNITDRKLLLKHFIFIPLRISFALLKGRFNSLIGFFWALSRLAEVIKKRRHEKQFSKVSDSEIFAKFICQR